MYCICLTVSLHTYIDTYTVNVFCSISRRALYGINRKRGLWVEEEAVDMSLKLHEVRGDAWMLGRFRLAATNGSIIFHLMLHTGKLGHGYEEILSFSRKCILNWTIFHCHVGLPECNFIVQL